MWSSDFFRNLTVRHVLWISLSWTTTRKNGRSWKAGNIGNNRETYNVILWRGTVWSECGLWMDCCKNVDIVCLEGKVVEMALFTWIMFYYRRKWTVRARTKFEPSWESSVSVSHPGQWSVRELISCVQIKVESQDTVGIKYNELPLDWHWRTNRIWV